MTIKRVKVESNSFLIDETTLLALFPCLFPEEIFTKAARNVNRSRVRAALA